MIINITKELLQTCLNVLTLSYEAGAIAFGQTEQNCPYRGRTRLPLEKLEEEFNNECLMYAYLINDEMVGFLSLSIFGDTLGINDIAILPTFQNKGFGSELLFFAKNKAKELNCVKIRLGMINDNLQLKKWYERYGFNTVRLRKYEAVSYTVGTMELYL